MNVVYAAAAYPAGVLSDNGDRGRVLIAGLAMLIVADLVLAAGPGIWGVLAGVALWGLHMGLTQGLLAALVADTVPPELRGTAFGMFNLVSGLALLAASILAGALWDAIGPQATFLAGAAFAAAALAGVLFLRKRGIARLAGPPR
jgi:MFS family permease